MAGRPIVTDLDLQENSIVNVVVHPLSSAPSNPKAGQIYFNTTDNNLYRYNGSTWVTYQAPLAAGTDYIAPPASANADDVLTYSNSSWVAAAPTVKQTAGTASSYTYWRPLVVGNASNSSEGFTPSTSTGGTYVFKTVEVQPSSGIIRMGGISMYNGSYTVKISPTTLTANRTVTLPNKDGTVAMTTDIPSVPTIASTTSLLKGDNGGNASAATAGTDYLAPPSSPSAGDVLTYDTTNGWIAATPSGGASIATTTSVLKGDNSGNAVAATAGTDFLAPPSSPSSGDYLTYSGSAWVAGGSSSVTTLGIDSAPTASSNNLVTSGGVYTALGTKQNNLPTQSGQSGKFLTTDGIDLSWGTPSGSTDVFWATYGTTTSAEIEAAYQAGKICCVTHLDSTFYLMRRLFDDEHIFTRASFRADHVEIGAIWCSNDTWSIGAYAADIPATDTITTTTTWTGSGPYTQTVTLANYTATSYTKVDIQPDSTAIAQLITDGVKALYVTNSSGTLTMTAIGAAPTVALTLQVTCEETEVAS